MWILTIMLSGCSSQTPEETAAANYVINVQPLMLENRLLAERQLKLAALIHDGQVPETGLAPLWTQEIVPLADHLARQAGALDVEPSWEDMHENLVVIWTDRAVAYRDMGEAVLLASGAGWEEAEALNRGVIQREEAWFRAIDAKLQPMNLSLEQYP